jgi:hypothetical protein
LPEEKRDAAYDRMRIDVFDALGEELPPARDNSTLEQLVAGSSEYDKQLKVKEDEVKKERLLEFQAALPGFRGLAEQAARSPEAKARLMSQVLEKFADVPEAREYALKTPTKEERTNSPSVNETIQQHDIDNVFKASRDFQDDPNTKNMDVIVQFVEPVSKQWADYKKAPTSAKRQFVEQNLIVAFAKIADPSSVVMPGEFKRTVLGQPWLKEIYNKVKAGTAIGGLGLDEKQLNTIANYVNLAKKEAVNRARPGYELMRDRIQDFKPGAVERETKRWKHLFEQKPKPAVKLNPEFEGLTNEQLQAELDRL